ncbi:MAG: type II toxin-antitoxin system prevent-host-death family antitoxin [Parvularculaceae bacterium]
MNIAEARAKLSALIEAAGRGDEIIIARNGEPVARLSSIAAWPRRRPGILRELYGLKGPPTPLEAFAPDPSFATRRRSANSGRFHRN